MTIDVHAHYVPRPILDALDDRAGDFGLRLVTEPPTCAVHFDGGAKLRPFFPKLIEEVGARLAAMDRQGVDRQVLSLWADMFGYGLPIEKRMRWHRLLNESLSQLCARHNRRFAMLASVPLPDAAAAARELDFAVRELGAVGAVVAANIEGVNLGEIALDEFWHAAVEHGVPVFIHPVQAVPVPRVVKFGLSQIAQYTFDTTLAVGSLIFSGALDRFPGLELILAHGGGAFPYLLGRFDCMHARMDKAAQGDVAAAPPSAYLRRFHYDTILHDAKALHWLAEIAGIDRVVLGSDYSFPPADEDPVGSVMKAGFSADAVSHILELNALRLFARLKR